MKPWCLICSKLFGAWRCDRFLVECERSCGRTHFPPPAPITSTNKNYIAVTSSPFLLPRCSIIPRLTWSSSLPWLGWFRVLRPRLMKSRRTCWLKRLRGETGLAAAALVGFRLCRMKSQRTRPLKRLRGVSGSALVSFRAQRPRACRRPRRRRWARRSARHRPSSQNNARRQRAQACAPPRNPT
jgi:hypothetical protein